MTLVEDIQQAAADSSVDLATLLRKCKLLSARLGSRPLEEWLILESNSYPDSTPVPEYRVWQLELKGHFSGPFGSGLRNAPIPLAILSDEVRAKYERWECRLSVASVETAIERAEGPVRLSAGDLALALGTTVYVGQNCLQAWAEFSSGHLIELLNVVRNRVLDFAVAIWKEAPQAGEFGKGAAQALSSEQVTQIFNTTIYGGTANLLGNAFSSTIAFAVAAHDFGSLERVLLAHGVTKEDVAELRSAVEQEPMPHGQKLGPKVSKWIAQMTEKAACGAWEIGLGAAGALLATVVAKYYGL